MLGKKLVKGLGTFLLGAGVGCSQSFAQVAKINSCKNQEKDGCSSYFSSSEKISDIIADRLKRSYIPLIPEKLKECVDIGEKEINKLDNELWEINTDLERIMSSLVNDESYGISELSKNRDMFIKKTAAIKNYDSMKAVERTFIRDLENLLYFDDETTQNIKKCIASKESTVLCNSLIGKSEVYLKKIADAISSCSREIQQHAEKFNGKYAENRKEILGGACKKKCLLF